MQDATRDDRGAPDNFRQAELDRFNELAHRWWDPEGPQKALHALNPARLAYVAERAPLSGARALGFETKIGSIESGKQADLVCVDLGQLETQPLHHVISQLIYATGRHQVSDVWIAGRPKLRDRVLVDMDSDALIANARQWRARIAAIRIS